jgi:hypothetical protein
MVLIVLVINCKHGPAVTWCCDVFETARRHGIMKVSEDQSQRSECHYSNKHGEQASKPHGVMVALEAASMILFACCHSGFIDTSRDVDAMTWGWLQTDTRA